MVQNYIPTTPRKISVNFSLCIVDGKGVNWLLLKITGGGVNTLLNLDDIICEQSLTEDVLEEHSVLPAGGGGEEGDEEGVSHDLSQGRRHPEACCETDLELQAYSGAVQIPAETSFSCPSCSTERTLSNLALAEQPSTLTKL